MAFGIPGGAILPAYDPLFDSRIRHILVRHSRARAARPRATRSRAAGWGSCIATSARAANLVTAIGNAYMDSTPLVAITGQVNGTAILSTGMRTDRTRGAVGAISSGPSMAWASTSRMKTRASRA